MYMYKYIYVYMYIHLPCGPNSSLVRKLIDDEEYVHGNGMIAMFSYRSVCMGIYKNSLISPQVIQSY